jgi:hypothetical protein
MCMCVCVCVEGEGKNHKTSLHCKQTITNQITNSLKDNQHKILQLDTVMRCNTFSFSHVSFQAEVPVSCSRYDSFPCQYRNKQ